ncbi:MAG: hypothetical protein AAGF07_05545 [Patescibacteria group bacterium]
MSTKDDNDKVVDINTYRSSDSSTTDNNQSNTSEEKVEYDFGKLPDEELSEAVINALKSDNTYVEVKFLDDED